MAKYASKTTSPVITDHIQGIVRDAMGFIESEFCRQTFLHTGGVDPRQWKYVRIHSHRRAGFSTSALKLLGEYKPSLIVTHSYHAANILREAAINDDLIPDWCEEDFYNKIKIADHIVPHERMNEQWFYTVDSDLSLRYQSNRYQLIILDGASMIESSRNRDGGVGFRDRVGPGMDGFRDRLFGLCDLLVELE